MKYLFLLTCSLFLIMQACQEPTVSLEEEISTLEANFAEKPTSETANLLLEKYAAYAQAYPDDDRANSRYLRKSARIYETAKEYVKAASTLVLALKKYYGSIETEANIATLIRYYKNLDNTEAAKATMNGYLMAFPNGSKVATYTNELGEDKISLPDQLAVIAQEIVQNTDGNVGLNIDAVNKYIGVAEIFALTNHMKDTLASDFLFKAGKLAMTIGNQEKAIECYHWVYTALSDSKEAPSAKFTHAFTLDNQLGKKDEAKVIYEEFLREYPNHHFADDTQFQLDNLGKGDDQILEELKKKAIQAK